MIDISRRWFVFGAASVIAVAALPSSVVLESIERIAAPHVFLKRHIREIMISFDVEPDTPAYVASVKIFIQDRPFLRYVLNVHSFLQWTAAPDDALIQLPTDTLNIITELPCQPSIASVVYIDTVCDDWIDDGPPIQVVERHTFPQINPPQPMFIHADNSLEARLARQEVARNFGIWHDSDRDDDDPDDET